MAFSRDRLDCDSAGILDRIGRGLRAYFDDTLKTPLPPDLQRLANQLADHAAASVGVEDQDGRIVVAQEVSTSKIGIG